MKLQFDPNQDYQLEAVAAIADLFAGQRRLEVTLQFGDGMSTFAAVPNRLDLTDAELLANLRTVQTRHRIAHDPALRALSHTADIAGTPRAISFPNFSVEMETGTGKTYVYIRTILELYRQYGFRKFIVVVPSLAIREGVLKTLDITRSHFQTLYNNPPYRFYAYSSGSLSQIRQFALSDGVEIMVMTLAAFNKDSNVIRQSTDKLQGETPIHLVQAARPILILDEPQNMESELSAASLALLNPLFALRYSATHRTPYNIVYRLTPYEAYHRNLVKKIEVSSVVREDATAAPYIRLLATATDKRTLTATVIVHKRMKDGSIRPATLKVKPGDSLVAKTNRREYAGYDIAEIHHGRGFVQFANTHNINVGEELGADKDAIFASQIRAAVQEHLEKQADFRALGVKVLSLFFIDRVDNYAPADGLIRTLFTRIFDELKHLYPGWENLSAADVQAAYFAQRRTKSGDVILEDSTSGEAAKDQDAYDLIMKDKERLLSFDEPVSFLFSHSALREGWDNPNVFQICTLNQTASEVRKRQEIGRGVRLAVNQSGARIRDERVNILTVIANESYHSFVAQIQSEVAAEYQAEIAQRYGSSLDDLTPEQRRAVEEEYGYGILPPKPANRRERTQVKLRKERVFTENSEFQTLWSKISAKTRYSVHIDSDQLVAAVIATLDEQHIPPPRVTVTKAVMSVNIEGVFEALQMSDAKTLASLVGRYPLPNMLDLIADLMEFTTPPMRITRRTVLRILEGLSPRIKQGMVENPNEFAKITVQAIKTNLTHQLVEGIQYHETGEWWQLTQFDEEVQRWADRLLPASRTIYDQVEYESGIEHAFVKGLESRGDVLLYVKLPDWFRIPTPIGEYNPDWAIVVQSTDATGRPIAGKKCYLVRETKGATNDLQLQYEHERLKTRCGRRHFQALGVSYEILNSAADLMLPADCASITQPNLPA